MEEVENPAIRNNSGRMPDGTFAKGFSGNPSGRPKGTLKDYVRQKFVLMSNEEKEEFLKNITPEMQWRMGEGNPKQDTEMGGEIIIHKPIYAGQSIQGHLSDAQDILTPEENQSSGRGDISEQDN